MTATNSIPEFPDSVFTPEQLLSSWTTNQDHQRGEKEFRKAAGEKSIDDGFFEVNEYRLDGFGRKTPIRTVRIPILDAPLSPEQALEKYIPLREKVQAMLTADEDVTVEHQHLSQMLNFMLAFVTTALDEYVGADGQLHGDVPDGLLDAMRGWAAWQNAQIEYSTARDNGADPRQVAMLYQRAYEIHDDLFPDVEYAIRQLTGQLPDAV